nr:uncharacterized protein LOC113714081 [Coffea arabica]
MTTESGEKATVHCRNLVSLLTDIRLKGKLGTYRTEDSGSDGLISTMPSPLTLVVDPSAKFCCAHCSLQVGRLCASTDSIDSYAYSISFETTYCYLFVFVGDSLAILRAELKSQRKHVRSLKKKSLWSKILEEVMEKLVDIVHFLHLEICAVFGMADGDRPIKNSHQRLGPAGLALHYANIISQIDTLVTRSSSVPPNTRDTLYQGLSPCIKLALRSKLQSFQLTEEMTVQQIKAEMEKTLHWLVPMATNTTKAHHGFGWVGEWASTGSEMNRKASGQTDLLRIETLHDADKEKTEAYILDLVVWLHHLVTQSRAGTRSPVKSPIRSPNQKTKLTTYKPNCPSPTLTIEDQEMLRDVSKRKLTPGISKSQEFDTAKTRLSKHHRLSKSSSHSPTSETKKEPFPIRRPSSVPVIDFEIDRIKALDVIDRVDTLRTGQL